MQVLRTSVSIKIVVSLLMISNMLQGMDVPQAKAKMQKMTADFVIGATLGNIERALNAINHNPNQLLEGKFPPLMLAVSSKINNLELCRALIDLGADVNAQREDGWTALIMATSAGNTEACKLLLESGAKVNMQSSNGKTALMFAAEAGHLEICKLLIQYSSNEPKSTLSAVANFNKSFLPTWIVETFYPLDDYEISSIQVKDKAGFSALTYAILNNHIKIAQLLINAMLFKLTKAQKDRIIALILALKKSTLPMMKDTNRLIVEHTIKGYIRQNKDTNKQAILTQLEDAVEFDPHNIIPELRKYGKELDKKIDQL